MAKSRMKTLIEPYVVRNGRHFRLKDVDPGDTAGFKSDKSLADAILQDGVATLQGLQEKLYAQDRWGVLLVFQAMDAAGKDGAIKHVMSGINPQGCQVFSFKQPSLARRSARAGTMEGLRRGLRGHDSAHRHVPRALGRRPGQQEMVRPVGRGRNRHRRARGAQSGVPESDRRQAERAPKGPPLLRTARRAR